MATLESYATITRFIKTFFKASVQLVQGEKDWQSLAQLYYTLLNLVIKLRNAVVQKTQNGSGRQVVAGFHFKNSASKGKTVRQIETANEKKSSRISL